MRESGDGQGQSTDALTGRELVVLQLRARGYSRRQVANAIALSVAEVAALERSACVTLGVRSIPEAVAEARRRGLIS